MNTMHLLQDFLGPTEALRNTLSTMQLEMSAVDAVVAENERLRRSLEGAFEAHKSLRRSLLFGNMAQQFARRARLIEDTVLSIQRHAELIESARRNLQTGLGAESDFARALRTLQDWCRSTAPHRALAESIIRSKSHLDAWEQCLATNRQLLTAFEAGIPVFDDWAEDDSGEHLQGCLGESDRATSGEPERLDGGAVPPSGLAIAVQTVSAELIGYLAKHPEALYTLRPRQFEELIAELLANFGWEVHLTPPVKDGGYDIFAISKGDAGVRTSWIVECKKYKLENKVGVDIARSLWGVKSDKKVANALLATTSHFTRDVFHFKASRYDLELRDFEGVVDWINKYRPHPDGQRYLIDNCIVTPDDPDWPGNR